MNSFKSIKKIKYESNLDELITLLEYMIFEDNQDKHYIVFKLKNNSSQQVRNIQFEVSQYDNENNLIRTSNILYNEKTIESGEVFVPSSKMIANQDCDHISIRLIEAVFEKMVYKNGECQEIKLGDEIKLDHPENISVKVNKSVVKKEKKKHGASQLKIRKMRSICPSFVAIMIVSICVLFTICSVVFSSLYQSVRPNYFSDDQFEYILENDEISINKYFGTKKEVHIPESVNGYPVTRIKQGAFYNNSHVETVDTEKIKVIESAAFYNCKNLKIYHGNNQVGDNCLVDHYAFYQCPSLEAFYDKGANLATGAFCVCRITDLQFYTTPSATYKGLFISPLSEISEIHGFVFDYDTFRGTNFFIDSNLILRK